MNEPEPDGPAHDEPRPDGPGLAWRGYAVEAAVGLVVALLLLWAAIASATDVPFVYQGL